MSRYIKFDDVVKVMACEMYAEAQSQGYDVDGIEDFMLEAKAWLNDAPSIDIVFCKECKYEDDCEQEVLLSEMYGEIEDTAHITYCSYGERRE